MLWNSRTRTPEPRTATRAVTLSDGTIIVRNPAIFGVHGRESCERFLGLVLALPEINSITIDRDTGTAELRHRVDLGGLSNLLGHLASAIRGRDTTTVIPTLPSQIHHSRFTIHRHGDCLTSWEVAHDGPGRLRLVHELLRSCVDFGRRVERDLGGVAGVRDAQANSRSGSVLIHYDSTKLDASQLIRAAEESLSREDLRSPAVLHSDPSRFVMVNATLAIATIVEFVAPALSPVSAVLLLATNLKYFKVAWLQVRARQLGLPVLYTAIVATTLLTGQFLASAIMTWLFRFWHRKFRVEMATERTRLLDTTTEPLLARLVIPDGSEILVDISQLKPGDRVVVEAGETVPADGHVIVGEGVIDERDVHGLEGVSRKRVGDAVLGGSTLLAGALGIEVETLGEATRGSSIRRALVAATSPTPGAVAPTLRSENYASRAVGPTLATAGVGLLTGDLLGVGAILRPDYATGLGLAVPLENLHDVTLCARRGIIALQPDMLERLDEVDVIVFDDHPSLARQELKVVAIHTRLSESVLLRHATSAFRHMDDDRALSLISTCKERHVPILNLDAVDFDPGVGVTVIAGNRRVRVRERDTTAGPWGALVVEVDGIAVGLLEFGQGSRPEAASTLRELREFSRARTMLVSLRAEAEIGPLAASLGVDQYKAELSTEATALLLREFRNRGLKTAYVGDCRARPKVAAEAYVAISLSGQTDQLDTDPADFVLPQCRLGPLVPLFAISQAHAGRVRNAHRMILIPNLVCVAGAFLFGFTGMTAVVISNLGTFSLYRNAIGALHELEPSSARRRFTPRSTARRTGVSHEAQSQRTHESKLV